MNHAPRLLLIPTAVCLLGCQTSRQHHPEFSAAPIAGSTVGRAVPVWMSDGSLATFSDTLPITGVQCASKFGLKDDFECIPDHRVGIREMTVPSDPDGYEGEAEWVIRFPRPIASYKDLSPERLDGTEVTVMGIIEGKALSKLGESGETRWAEACVGNNVLTGGSGYTARLADLRCLTPGKLKLTTRFLDPSENPVAHPSGRTSWREVDFSESEVQKALDPVMFQKWIERLASSGPATKRIRHLNLSALGKECAAVNSLKYQTPATFFAVGKMVVCPWRWRPSSDLLRDDVRAFTVKNLVRAGDCVPPMGGVIKLTFTHPGARDEAILRVVR